MPFTFDPIPVRKWHGKYRHPMRTESVFHVGCNGRIEVRWRDSGLNYTCPVEQIAEVRELATVLNQVKRQFTGKRGGAFTINEFSQVICPVANNDCERFLVGNCTGAFRVEDPEEDGKYFQMDRDADLDIGHDWYGPYLGIKYNLKYNNRIYFVHQLASGQRYEDAPFQDPVLIRNLRDIRPHGGVSFVVTMHGIALTQCEDSGTGGWRTVYAGRINYNRWFPKEA